MPCKLSLISPVISQSDTAPLQKEAFGCSHERLVTAEKPAKASRTWNAEVALRACTGHISVPATKAGGGKMLVLPSRTC